MSEFKNDSAPQIPKRPEKPLSEDPVAYADYHYDIGVQDGREQVIGGIKKWAGRVALAGAAGLAVGVASKAIENGGNAPEVDSEPVPRVQIADTPEGLQKQIRYMQDQLRIMQEKQGEKGPSR